MIMDGMSAAQPKSSTVQMEHLDLSYEPFNFSSGQLAGGDAALGGRGGVGAIVVGASGESAFDDTLNTPRTATSDFNFNFIKSQMEFSQEAPPIIGMWIQMFRILQNDKTVIGKHKHNKTKNACIAHI